MVLFWATSSCDWHDKIEFATKNEKRTIRELLHGMPQLTWYRKVYWPEMIDGRWTYHSDPLSTVKFGIWERRGRKRYRNGKLFWKYHVTDQRSYNLLTTSCGLSLSWAWTRIDSIQCAPGAEASGLWRFSLSVDPCTSGCRVVPVRHWGEHVYLSDQRLIREHGMPVW